MASPPETGIAVSAAYRLPVRTARDRIPFVRASNASGSDVASGTLPAIWRKSPRSFSVSSTAARLPVSAS